jgi:hypothetical protein
MAGGAGFEPEPHLPPATSLCTLTEQMSRYSLRLAHDLKPAMTGWQAFVAAERIVASTANDQQPRGY